MNISPKNWRDFQHYKNRRPPWIRLHRSLLDNREFISLPTASKALAPLLWLLASESMDGEIDATPQNLAFRLRMTEKEVNAAIRPLIDRGFFEVVGGDASKPLASGQQVAPESCSESEESRDRDRDRGGASAPSSRVSEKPPEIEGLDTTAWDQWQAYRKLPPKSIPAAQRKMAQLGALQAEAVEHSIGNGYRGLFAPKVNGSRGFETHEERIKRQFLEGTQ